MTVLYDMGKHFFAKKRNQTPSSQEPRCGRFFAGKDVSKEKTVALAGNPNVGKSTVFNALTKLRQHTGNWPGKTVQNACGRFWDGTQSYALYDLPGAYSLLANSAEEETARDFLCFSNPDATIVVADATCLERSLNLVLQITEITDRAVLCVNLMDEAEKKGIAVDLKLLSERLGIPVAGTSARSGKGLSGLVRAVRDTAFSPSPKTPVSVTYGDAIEAAIAHVEPLAAKWTGGRANSRWVALRLLEGDESLLAALQKNFGAELCADTPLRVAADEALFALNELGITREDLRDRVAASLVNRAEALKSEAVTEKRENYRARDERVDKLITSRVFGYPLMLLLLFLILWLTIAGANAPSALLSQTLFALMPPLNGALASLGAPPFLQSLLVDGMYKTLAWVVSVMLPPMAIFFPLFTLLEDWGYLPRVAFNLDGVFSRAGAHGKQALTTCMVFIIL